MTSLRATIRTVVVPVAVLAAAAIIMYPEIRTLLRGDPPGSGIADIIVGLLTILLYLGLELISRLSTISRFEARSERWAVLALLTMITGINVVLIYTVGESPAAVGMVVVCIVFALFMLVSPNTDQPSSQS